MSHDLIGRKVAFAGNGWSTYAMKPAKYCLFLDNSVDLKYCANAFVNPFTALAMLHFAEQKQAKAVI